jgi:two-component system response regulator HupR/HoxA
LADQLRVLLVDDEPAVVETTEALLAEEFQVVTASNGAAALAELSRAPFDVICSDFNMPGMTGAELLCRAQKEAPGVGCVLITGFREYASRDRAGVTGHMVLLKPYEPNKLLELVRSAGASARLKRQLLALNPSLGKKPA